MNEAPADDAPAHPLRWPIQPKVLISARADMILWITLHLGLATAIIAILLVLREISEQEHILLWFLVFPALGIWSAIRNRFRIQHVSLDDDQLVDDTRDLPTRIHLRHLSEIHEYSTCAELRYRIGESVRHWRLQATRMTPGDFLEFTTSLKALARAANPEVVIHDLQSGPPVA